MALKSVGAIGKPRDAIRKRRQTLRRQTLKHFREHERHEEETRLQAKEDMRAISRECRNIPHSDAESVDPDGLAAIMARELRALNERVTHIEERFRRAESSLRESGVL
jgi:hypothetical protein